VQVDSEGSFAAAPIDADKQKAPAPTPKPKPVAKEVRGNYSQWAFPIPEMAALIITGQIFVAEACFSTEHQCVHPKLPQLVKCCPASKTCDACIKPLLYEEKKKKAEEPGKPK